MALSFIEQFNLARRASAPLVAIRTPDIEATIKTITLHKDEHGKFVHAASPIILHDCVRGVTGANEQGKQAIRACFGSDPAAVAPPIEALVKAKDLPKETIFFMANLHRFFLDPLVVQGIANLRNVFKTNTRTLVIVCPDVTLPPEIAQDVVVLDEPLPDENMMEAIVAQTYDAVDLPHPPPELMARAKDALCGLPAFGAEQVCAMSIRKKGMDLEFLWERKRQQIEQTPGLKVWRGAQRFADIGGCTNVKTFLTAVMNGKDRPRAIVFQDEIEKQYAGAAGDLSGTTQELLGEQLSFMQDHDSAGVMSIGHPGVAKSDIAKALGNEAGIPTIQLVLGNAKGGIIGESNANMRTILKVIEAVSQGRALWIATCNDIKSLPPELRNRYTFGTFFYDLPTILEREVIWNIYFEKFGLKDREKPADTGWNGREIKNCCLLAHRLGIPLRDAAKYIIPMYTSSSERIAALRNEADNRYISAAYSGPYKKPEGMDESYQPEELVVAVATMRRKINPGEGGEPVRKGGKKESVN